MKKILTTLIAAIVLTGAAHADETSVKKLLLTKFPKLPEGSIIVKNLKAEGIDSLYEVNLGGTSGYTDEKVSYLFTSKGEMWATKNMENLSVKRTNSRIKDGIASLNPEKNAIKAVYGNGKRKIYVFSDPDCPYCKQFERDLASGDGQRLDATVYTFLYPLTNLHPEAARKSEAIWCAGDNSKRLKAWAEWMTKGVAIPDSGKCATPMATISSVGIGIGINSTPSIILGEAAIIPGAVPVAKLVEALNELDKSPDAINQLNNAINSATGKR